MQSSYVQPNNNLKPKNINVVGIITASLSSLLKNKKLAIFLFAIFFGVNIAVAILSFIVGEGAGKAASAIAGALLGAFMQISYTYNVFSALKNRFASPKECLKVASNNKLLGSVALTYLLIALSFLISLIFLVVPAIIVMTMFAVALPVCVLEGLKPIDSLKRSMELTKGYRWPVFFVMLASFIAVSVIAGVTFSVLIPILVSILPTIVFIIIITIIGILFSFVVQLYFYSVYTVLYFELRSIKDGVAMDKLVTVFE